MADPSSELAVYQPSPAPALDDREIDRLYRIAKGLAASGLFKDVRQAEQAFAKLIVGRDLGLTPAQSLSLYAMEGKIEVPYPMLAMFVRARPGYDYSIEWHEGDGGEVTGCSVTFTVGGEERGVSTFTDADAERAGLMAKRGSKDSNFVLYPRNMLLARAMSNGCKWYVPEVLAGLPIYVEGEIERVPNLSDGEGTGEGPGWGELPPAAVSEVRRIIRRAEKAGHAQLSNEATVQMLVSGMTDDAVRAWLQQASDELADMDAVSVIPVEGGGGTTVPVTGDGEPVGDVQPVDPDREAELPFDEAESLRLDAEAASE